MDTLQIDTGEKRIAINNDPDRVIVFNPTDVFFVERFYMLAGEAEQKADEYRLRAQALEKDTQKGDNGLPSNLKARLVLLRESCDYMRAQIDSVFGEGTSQKAFGDAMTLDMFKQFFDGIKPFFQQARVQKIAQYTTTASAKRNKPKRNRTKK